MDNLTPQISQMQKRREVDPAQAAPDVEMDPHASSGSSGQQKVPEKESPADMQANINLLMAAAQAAPAQQDGQSK